MMHVVQDFGCLALLQPSVLGRLYDAPEKCSMLRLALDVCLRATARRMSELRDEASIACVLGIMLGGPTGSPLHVDKFGSMGSGLMESVPSNLPARFLFIRSFCIPLLQATHSKSFATAFTSRNSELGQSPAFVASQCLMEWDAESESVRTTRNIVRWNAFTLIAIVFDKLTKEDIDSKI